MRAICQSRYGNPAAVLELRDVPPPRISDDQVLVRIRATSVHADVWHAVTGRPALLRLTGAGVRRPKNPIPGTDLAGYVQAVGGKVARFRVGDEVFGSTLDGNLWWNGGTFAEYAAVPERALAAMPPGVSFAQAAAATTSGLVALNNLQPPRAIQPGWQVLVNGAGGAVGAIVVQLAKAAGAQVTAIDSASKQPLLGALGADLVIDYCREDFTTRAERYDLIFDVASNLSYAACRRTLRRGGKYVLIGHDHFGRTGGRWLGSVPRALALAAHAVLSPPLRPAFHSAIPNDRALPVLRELLATQKIAPIIAQTYPLSGARAALHHLISGEALGRIVITP